MNIGQITKNNIFGQLLYNLSLNKEIKNIVEIGTWTGMGSTKCIIDGLLQRNDDYNFITIELYPNMYNIALKNLEKVLSDKIKIYNGRIIDINDIYWFDHSTINFNINEHAKLYYYSDIEYLKTMPNIIKEIPQTIDLLILDGGEYSTYPEYLKLKTRTKIFALDDTKLLKCSKIRYELLNEKYDVIHDDINNRNGTSIFRKK